MNGILVIKATFLGFRTNLNLPFPIDMFRTPSAHMAFGNIITLPPTPQQPKMVGEQLIQTYFKIAILKLNFNDDLLIHGFCINQSFRTMFKNPFDVFPQTQ